MAYEVVSQEQTYAKVLRELRMHVNPKDRNTSVLRSRPTQNGDVPLQLSNKSNKSDKAASVQQVGKTIQTTGEVRVTEKRVTLVIRDPDAMRGKRGCKSCAESDDDAKEKDAVSAAVDPHYKSCYSPSSRLIHRFSALRLCAKISWLTGSFPG